MTSIPAENLKYKIDRFNSHLEGINIKRAKIKDRKYVIAELTAIPGVTEDLLNKDLLGALSSFLCYFFPTGSLRTSPLESIISHTATIFHSYGINQLIKGKQGNHLHALLALEKKAVEVHGSVQKARSAEEEVIASRKSCSDHELKRLKVSTELTEEDIKQQNQLLEKTLYQPIQASDISKLITTINEKRERRKELLGKLNHLTANGKLSPDIAYVNTQIQQQKQHLRDIEAEIENKYEDPAFK